MIPTFYGRSAYASHHKKLASTWLVTHIFCLTHLSCANSTFLAFCFLPGCFMFYLNGHRSYLTVVLSRKIWVLFRYSSGTLWVPLLVLAWNRLAVCDIMKLHQISDLFIADPDLLYLMNFDLNSLKHTDRSTWSIPWWILESFLVGNMMYMHILCRNFCKKFLWPIGLNSWPCHLTCDLWPR